MAKEGEASTTTHEQNIALQCPKLTETNYTTWAIMMETILKAYGMWETIVAKEGKAIANEKKENTSKAMIFQTLPQDVLMQVAQYSTTKEVWDSIKVKYLGADLVQKARLQTLNSELETLRMKPNETVSDFGGKLSGIKAKYKGLGGALEEKVLVRKLLNSVPKKFLPIVATIEQYQDLDKMTFEEAMGRLIAYEERLKGQQEEPETRNEEGLLMAKETNSDNWQRKWHGNRNYGRGRGRNFNKGERSRGRDIHQGERDKKDMKCYSCNNYGHFAYECTKLKENDKNEESLLAYYSDEDAKLL